MTEPALNLIRRTPDAATSRTPKVTPVTPREERRAADAAYGCVEWFLYDSYSPATRDREGPAPRV